MDLNFLYTDTAAARRLRDYVNQGGSLYVSDWAQEVVREMFPGDLGGERIGDDQTIFGRVTDQGLRTFVWKDSVEIRYDLGSWETLDTLSSRPTVLLRGNYRAGGLMQTNKALAILISHGSGRVVYTTFHNEANVTRDAVKVLTYFLHIL